jgi:hypothetical protein
MVLPNGSPLGQEGISITIGNETGAASVAICLMFYFPGPVFPELRGQACWFGGKSEVFFGE